MNLKIRLIFISAVTIICSILLRNRAPQKTDVSGYPANTNSSATSILSQWKYLFGKENRRDAVLKFTNLCLDGNKLFYPTKSMKRPPPTNIAASSKEYDIWLSIHYGKLDVNYKYVSDRPLFVIGTVSPHHLSHFYVNNYMPIINLLNNYYESYEWIKEPRDLHIARQSVVEKIIDFKSLNFTNVFDTDNLPHDITCYKSVIVGLNNTCDCCGCMKDYEDLNLHSQSRNLIMSFHTGILPPNISALEIPTRAIIVQRRNSRSILNLSQVENALKELGVDFQTIELEDYSLKSQIEIFSKTNVLIAVHGNAIINSFWMPKDSLVIEAHSWKQGSLWFKHVFGDSLSHPITHQIIKCAQLSCSDGGISSFNAGTTIDILELKMIISNFEKSKLIKK